MIPLDDPKGRSSAFLEDFGISTSRYLGLAFDEAIDDNPIIGRVFDQVRIDYLRSKGAREEEEWWNPDRISEMATKMGVKASSIPQGGLPESAAKFLLNRQYERKQRRAAIDRAENSWTNLGAGFAAGLGGSMLDPLNMASAFVPVVNPARYASMLAKASGPGARFLTRLGVGAAEGAVGAVLVEPINVALADVMGDDYGMADALVNLGFGTVLGGGLQAGAGALSDAMTHGISWQRAAPKGNVAEELFTKNPEFRRDLAKRTIDRTVRDMPLDTEEVADLLEVKKGQADLDDEITFFDDEDNLTPEEREIYGGRKWDREAFPGEPRASQENRLPITEGAQPVDGLVHIRGRDTTINAGDGLKAHYGLASIDETITSHHHKTWEENPEFAPARNDRNYQDPVNHNQVVEHSMERNQRLGFFIDSGETPVDGPPMIDKDGKTFGGNSRNMVLKRWYDWWKSGANKRPYEAYLEDLRARASEFNLNPDDVKPGFALYRFIDDDLIADVGNWPKIITDLNPDNQKVLTVSEKAAMGGQRLSSKTVAIVNEELATKKNLTAVLADDKAAMKIVNALEQDGVFESGKRGDFVEGDMVIPEARGTIQRILSYGFLLDQTEIFGATPITKNKLLEVAEYIVKMERSQDQSYNLNPVIRNAVKLARLEESNLSRGGPELIFQQLGIFEKIEDYEIRKKEYLDLIEDPRVFPLAQGLVRSKNRAEFAKYMKAYWSEAQTAADGVQTLFGGGTGAKTSQEIVEETFGSILPRGEAGKKAKADRKLTEKKAKEAAKKIKENNKKPEGSRLIKKELVEANTKKLETLEADTSIEVAEASADEAVEALQAELGPDIEIDKVMESANKEIAQADEMGEAIKAAAACAVSR